MTTVFHSARLKLTAWYLVAIILVSAAFSVAIYLGVAYDLSRRFSDMEQRMAHQNMMGSMSSGMHNIFDNDLRSAKSRVLLILLVADGVILLFSTAGGYFLAGRTLKPIQVALDEQKRFIADASHELKTPLTVMKTTLEVALRDKNLKIENAIESLSSNLEEVEKMRLLTANLIELARSQEIKDENKFQTVDIAELLKVAVKKGRSLMKDKDIDLKLETESLELEADKQKLAALIMILIDNAIKYTQSNGRIKISSKREGKYALIEVADNGIGIAEAELPHIFNRFYRADKSRSKTTVAGFGLGLALAKQIVASHQGIIEAGSIVNSGTTFIIKLPLKQF